MTYSELDIRCEYAEPSESGAGPPGSTNYRFIYRRTITLTIDKSCITKVVGPWQFVRLAGCCDCPQDLSGSGGSGGGIDVSYCFPGVVIPETVYATYVLNPGLQPFGPDGDCYINAGRGPYVLGVSFPLVHNAPGAGPGIWSGIFNNGEPAQSLHHWSLGLVLKIMAGNPAGCLRLEGSYACGPFLDGIDCGFGGGMGPAPGFSLEPVDVFFGYCPGLGGSYNYWHVTE